MFRMVMQQNWIKQTARQPGYYIPHHAATNVNKLNKGRIVFDAGEKAKGKSWNELLLEGPTFSITSSVFY